MRQRYICPKCKLQWDSEKPVTYCIFCGELLQKALLWETGWEFLDELLNSDIFGNRKAGGVE